MLNVITSEKVNKGFIKTGELQRQLTVLRAGNAELRPIDAANALLDWFQSPDNEFVRLDVLHYAISHLWGTVTSKLETPPVQATRISKEIVHKRVARDKRATTVAKAVDEAMEQMVATLKNMTFKQARALHGATANLDLGRGSDDQRLGDVFDDKEIRAALK